MICRYKKCKYREFNGGDDISDFYYCKLAGTEVGRGEEECLIDKWRAEDERN
jgi:hypothetical protein